MEIGDDISDRVLLSRGGPILYNIIMQTQPIQGQSLFTLTKSVNPHGIAGSKANASFQARQPTAMTAMPVR